MITSCSPNFYCEGKSVRFRFLALSLCALTQREHVLSSSSMQWWRRRGRGLSVTSYHLVGAVPVRALTPQRPARPSLGVQSGHQYQHLHPDTDNWDIISVWVESALWFSCCTLKYNHSSTEQVHYWGTCTTWVFTFYAVLCFSTTFSRQLKILYFLHLLQSFSYFAYSNY